MMSRMAKVDVFYENGTVPTTNYLEEIFTDVTNVSPNDDPLHLFSAIMLPVRDYDTTNNRLSDNYTYHNVGLTTTELADLYWTQYSGTYLIGAGRGKSLSEDSEKLKLRCRSIFRKNYGKYLKMIEMEGLVWNPLWNVDGTEIRQLLENNGTTDVESGRINTTAGVQWNDNKTTHNVSSYDDATLKLEYTDETNGSGSNIPTGIQKVTYSNNDFSVSDQSPSGSQISRADESTVGEKGSTKYIHNNAKNIVNGADADYTVSSGDTAFGYALTGGDKMHVEKYIRQGNIGVTETTQLLEHARNYLRFSVVQEFFNDINKVILIGIYGDIAPVPWWEVGQGSGGGTISGHPDTGRIPSVYNNMYDMIQSVELDEYGHVIGLTTCDGVTRMSTPMTQAQYDDTDPKDLPLYYIYENDET